MKDKMNIWSIAMSLYYGNLIEITRYGLDVNNEKKYSFGIVWIVFKAYYIIGHI